MSSLAEHEREQDRITAECEAGECDHPECSATVCPECDGRIRIDAIKFHTQQNAAGRTYDVVRLWIGHVPFSADLCAQNERMARRIAREAGLEVQDRRRITP